MKKPPSISELFADMDAARKTWSVAYSRIRKHGGSCKERYAENGLWRRFKNREKKYNAALKVERNAVPA
jgi:hypothetical protein